MADADAEAALEGAAEGIRAGITRGGCLARTLLPSTGRRASALLS
jgi:hypothetical protein